MDRFDALLSEMDLEFFGTSSHAVSAESAVNMADRKDVFFLDVRSSEETSLLSFPFAVNIPVNEVPKRLEELPTDKLIVVICSSVFRAAMVYTYLRYKGFEQVKGLAAGIEQMAAFLKPGPIFKRKQKA
ncbi:MAG: rhodanese-like domain-containing protein [Desulfobacterales bacterium]|nr:rhodanese-like domain-containing protein [Desulfobacterales bacterium]MDD4071649.1 rhodanese-like domain-containing protein [Desulfobacterales bacterium]MDD4393560.1 rhodanese-like domain-containing protein [Desulfobacterales bacterium]